MKLFLIPIMFAIFSQSVLAASILFVDDSNGRSTPNAWFNTMSGLGYSYDSESISVNGNSTFALSNYDAVIWSVGDRAYSNLTAQNVNDLQSYLNGGGNLLYAGGHNVYSESNANGFISNYLGLSNYQNNMPYFSNNSTSTGTGHAVTSNNVYDLQIMPSPNTHGGNMMSGFNVSTADSMMTSPQGGPFIAAVNQTLAYSAMTWGFDITMLEQQFQRDQLLGDSLAFMGVGVPEPENVALLGVALAGLGLARRRREKI